MIVLKIKLSFILLLILVLNACNSKHLEENQLKPVEVDSIDTQSPTAYDRYAQYKTTFAFDPLPLKDSTIALVYKWVKSLDDLTKEEVLHKEAGIWITYYIHRLRLEDDLDLEVYKFQGRLSQFINYKLGLEQSMPTIIFTLNMYDSKFVKNRDAGFKSSFMLEIIPVEGGRKEWQRWEAFGNKK